jgi:hypothetical protein
VWGEFSLVAKIYIARIFRAQREKSGRQIRAKNPHGLHLARSHARAKFSAIAIPHPPHAMKKPSEGNKTEIGKKRGRAAAKKITPESCRETMKKAFEYARQLFPTAANVHFEDEIRKFDSERLASQPNIGRFPELKGHIDLLTAERKAFRESTGLDEAVTAFHYSWDFYVSRRITSRHLARYEQLPVMKGCTNVFFPHGAEGVTISDNRDIPPVPECAAEVAAFRPEYLLKQSPINWVQGGVSAAVLLDDEPSCLFPADPYIYDLMPEECLENIDDMTEFLGRYREFWGPGNKILVDRQLRAVAVDKTNCLVAFRKPTVNGAVAVTACSYLDERLHQHQMEKTRKCMAIKGDNEKSSLDLNYHLGSRKRYQRLVDLTNKEAARPGGATLWGALEVVADHVVPFPARVCLAGEKIFDEPNANWSVTQHAAVITGPRKRCLYRSIPDFRNPRPVYSLPLKLMLGSRVKMQPEWQADIDAGRCQLPS